MVLTKSLQENGLDIGSVSMAIRGVAGTGVAEDGASVSISSAVASCPTTMATEDGWPAPPAAEAFLGLAGDLIRVIEPHSEADAVALLVQFLAAFGNCVGRGPHIEIEADSHHTNLFGVLVGRSAKARKGTSWGHIRRLFEAVDPDWASERCQSGLSSGEGLIWAVRDPVEKPKPAKEGGEP